MLKPSAIARQGDRWIVDMKDSEEKKEWKSQGSRSCCWFRILGFRFFGSRFRIWDSEFRD